MSKGLDSARQALDKLKTTEAKLRQEIKQKEQQLKQAEKAELDRMTTAIGRTALSILPESLHTDEALLIGLFLSAQTGSPEALDAWRSAGQNYLESAGKS